MKKLVFITIIASLVIPTIAVAQEHFFEELTEKYADADGFSASLISNDMFDLYLKKRGIEDESPVSETLKNLDYILVASQSKFGSEEEPDLENIRHHLHCYISDTGHSLKSTCKSAR